MYYCIGYRLGLNPLKEEVVQEGDMALGMVLEFQNDLIQLTSKQTMVYDLIFAKEKNHAKLIEQLYELCSGMKISEIDLQNIVKDLSNQNVIVEINSDDEFMDKLGSYKLVRQGSSSFSFDDFKKNGISTPCIRLVNFEIPISDFELKLWRECNGNKTIKELRNEYFSEYDLFDFVYAIRNMKIKSTLYII